MEIYVKIYFISILFSFLWFAKIILSDRWFYP